VRLEPLAARRTSRRQWGATVQPSDVVSISTTTLPTNLPALVRRLIVVCSSVVVSGPHAETSSRNVITVSVTLRMWYCLPSIPALPVPPSSTSCPTSNPSSMKLPRSLPFARVTVRRPGLVASAFPKVRLPRKSLDGT
jgi:hypothetical protein